MYMYKKKDMGHGKCMGHGNDPHRITMVREEVLYRFEGGNQSTNRRWFTSNNCRYFVNIVKCHLSVDWLLAFKAVYDTVGIHWWNPPLFVGHFHFPTYAQLVASNQYPLFKF